MIIGYTRNPLNCPPLPDSDQPHPLQALKAFGCQEIFEDKLAEKKAPRIQLQSMLSGLCAGDQVVVYKLDHLADSLRETVQLVHSFGRQGVEFISLQDQLNTTTDEGKLIFQVFAALSALKWKIAREGTRAGLARALTRGRRGGRPSGISPAAQQKATLARELYQAKHLSVKEICRQLAISRPTLYRYLKEA